MGRSMGRRPDPTDALARAVRRHLESGEDVRAGVYAQRPGSFAAAMEGGASGAIAGALDAPMSFRASDDDGPGEAWRDELVHLGADRDVARRTVHVAVVLTSRRLFVLRRSNLTRRVRQPLVVLPVETVEGIDVSTRSTALVIRSTSGPVHLELPQAHRFLPDVYRDLPSRLREVREEQASRGR